MLDISSMSQLKTEINNSHIGKKNKNGNSSEKRTNHLSKIFYQFTLTSKSATAKFIMKTTSYKAQMSGSKKSSCAVSIGMTRKSRKTV